MIKLENLMQIERTILTANAEKETLYFERTGVNREFRVSDNEGLYDLNFKIDWLGKRYADCTCPISSLGLICQHIICVTSLKSCQLEDVYFKQEDTVTY